VIQVFLPLDEYCVKVLSYLCGVKYNSGLTGCYVKYHPDISGAEVAVEPTFCANSSLSE